MEDIREDIRVARRSLEREGYLGFRGDEWLLGEKKTDAEDGGARQQVRGGEEAEAERKRNLPGVGQKDHVGISQME